MNRHSRGAIASRWLLLIVVLAGFAFLCLHFAQFENFVDLLRRAQPAWLVAALALQITTYASVAAGWNVVLRRAGSPQSLRRLIPVAVSKLFADQAIPGAGMGGNVMLIERLIALEVPRPAAMAALLVSMIAFYATYGGLAVGMLLALWSRREASSLLTGVVTTFLLVAIAIPSLALWLRHRGSRPLPPTIEGIAPVRKLLRAVSEAPAVLVNDRKLIGRVMGFNALIFFADAATLATCLCAVGEPLHPLVSFIALMSGSIAITLAPVPLGLGTFEGSCIAMLTLLGVKIEAAIAATLLLRGFTLWLPLLLGFFLMTHHRREGA
jgi:uncharacterized protein (TIRG00374 family)